MPQQPQWQPISQLALIGSHIDGMLEAAQEQYQTHCNRHEPSRTSLITIRLDA